MLISFILRAFITISHNNSYATTMTLLISQNIDFLCWRIAQKCWTVYQIIFLLTINIIIKWTAKNYCINIFAILNFSCNKFTVFRIIIKRNPQNWLFCYNTYILHYHWLSHFPVACPVPVVSHFSIRCCKTFAIVLCFYGDHITRAKLRKNLCLRFIVQFPRSYVELEKFDACAVSYHYHYHLYHKRSKLV